ncbi:MAG: hypothetical protein KKC75_07715 [Nanoarchaeota archaeon]|nr:hypothetical protein [Nanoarchaeota archaeon]MBU1005076.1 hypothetical protein [Nanoarchaeota archaeon]MBU1945361.1 hypothetical protein [Nanoarchaeota archaeon]
MKYKFFISVLFILLMVNLASAVVTYQETSSVSRIVGESPAEMIKQMQRNSIDLKGATYYSGVSQGGSNSLIKRSVLEKQFGFGDLETAWGLDSFEDLMDEMEKNELLVLEAGGQIDPLKISAYYEEREPNDIKRWQEDFKKSNPLFILDSPYGGAYLPKEDSFVSRLVRDSTIIAPMSFNTEQFVTSTLCMLYNKKTVGQLFRDARNFHYNGGSSSDSNNYIGLVLQSYALYGNPMQKIRMDEYDLNKIKNNCKNFLQNLADGIEYIGQEGNYSKFRKHLVFSINEYGLSEEGNFTIINASNTFSNLEYGELVLPKSVRTTYFPKNTIIMNVTVDAAYDLVELTVEDLPAYEFDLVNRTCYYENQAVRVEFSSGYSDDSQEVAAIIYPVEVVNCTEGKFKLYRKFNYSIEYIAISPVLVKEIMSPAKSEINQEIQIGVKLMNMRDDSVNGLLAIFDKDNNKVYEEEINTSITEYNASFFAPSEEGFLKYSVEFLYNNETASYKDFYIETSIIELQANIPISAKEDQIIPLDIYSYSNESFNLRMDYYLMRNYTILQNGTINNQMNEGLNTEQIQLSNLKKEDQSYTLTIEMTYLNQKKSYTYLINTNSVPLVYVDTKRDYEENKEINISVSSFDYDNDTIILAIDDSRFVKEGDSFVWRTTYYDNGTYDVNIIASDGLLIKKESVIITVLDLNKRYNVTLDEGWNLISMPLPLNESIENVFAPVKDKIAGIFSYEDERWKKYKPFDSTNSLEEIKSINGYWIKANEPILLSVLITPEENIVYDLDARWNLIGYISKEENDIGLALSGIGYSKVMGYSNNSWQSYDKNKPDVLNKLKILKPGYGYWINMNDNITIELDTETGLFSYGGNIQRGGGEVG